MRTKRLVPKRSFESKYEPKKGKGEKWITETLKKIWKTVTKIVETLYDRWYILTQTESGYVDCVEWMIYHGGIWDSRSLAFSHFVVNFP